MKEKSKFIVPAVIILSIAIIFSIRLFQWQVIDAENYQSLSVSSSSSFVKIESARGEILDTNGVVLAGSETVYNINMNALTMASDRNDALEYLVEIFMQYDIAWVDVLPIELDIANNYSFKENCDSEIAYLLGENMLNLDEDATAKDCMKALAEKYSYEGETEEMTLAVLCIRYGMTRSQFSISNPYTIAEDISLEIIQIIEEYSSYLPGIETEISTQRYYENGDLVPHIIGTYGLISQDMYDQYVLDGNTYSSSNVSGYSYTDKAGRSGIEAAFEEELRGINGKQSIVTDDNGNKVLGEITEVPQAGNNVYLTIDSQLQDVLNESLQRNIEASTAEDAVAGAAVILDVETFGVLAASTVPSYDLGLYTSDYEYYAMLLEDENTPLFNRAFDGVYPPGSVMKPAVGIAALEEGVINIETLYYCDKVYDYYETNPLKCIGSHLVGYVDIFTAISSSCNSFFCDAGRLLGIEAMEVYANLFGLGVKTGIEISESSGIMTNPQEYEEAHNTNWTDGLTIQAAIGQADNMFTPLQLATYVATIANDGVRLETHLLDKIMDFNNTTVIEEYEPVVAETIDISMENLEIIQEGMRLVATEGTASSTFADYGIAIAEKTGTAQNTNNSDTVSFIAYAPYDDPEIAIAITIEYGDSGVLTRNVAKDVFDWYFFGISYLDEETEETVEE